MEHIQHVDETLEKGSAAGSADSTSQSRIQRDQVISETGDNVAGTVSTPDNDLDLPEREEGWETARFG